MQNRLWMAIGIALSVCFLCSGCFWSTKGPIETQWYQSQPEIQPNLIVFLRGMGGANNCFLNPHECFDEKGFISSVKNRQLPYDMVAPNMHFGYYKDRSFINRLKEDIILPAQAKGYRNIWLAGVSMGGLGSIFYLKEHPEDIKGIVILGPYLGNADIIDELDAAGGLETWHPGKYNPEDQWQADIWKFLKQHPYDSQEKPPIFLGLGKQDYYIKGQEILADYLPPERVIKIEGKHRFSTFYELWELFLKKNVL